ncbi:MAG TPA: hypothetical protein VGO40_24185, partial [Longimicrobium sp.]|nr:hypothetical protein [Longimicrobium sp.]
MKSLQQQHETRLRGLPASEPLPRRSAPLCFVWPRCASPLEVARKPQVQSAKAARRRTSCRSSG